MNGINDSKENIGRIGVMEKNKTVINFENNRENIYRTKYKCVVDKKDELKKGYKK